MPAAFVDDWGDRCANMAGRLARGNCTARSGNLYSGSSRENEEEPSDRERTWFAKAKPRCRGRSDSAEHAFRKVWDNGSDWQGGSESSATTSAYRHAAEDGKRRSRT